MGNMRQRITQGDSGITTLPHALSPPVTLILLALVSTWSKYSHFHYYHNFITTKFCRQLYKMQTGKQVQLDNNEFFFTNDLVRECNKLSPSVVQSDTINSFKNKLDHRLLQ